MAEKKILEEIWYNSDVIRLLFYGICFSKCIGLSNQSGFCAVFRHFFSPASLNFTDIEPHISIASG